MINILIVDDSPEKIRSIIDVLCQHPQIEDKYLSTSSDLVTARRQLSQNSFDLLILDLNLPERFGDEPKKFSGVEFLQECKESHRLYKPFHIIGLTQYEELILEFKNNFEDELWVLLHYSPSSEIWKDRLINKIDYLVQSKNELSIKEQNEYKYDIGIITALHDPELAMVRALDANWRKIEVSNDPTPYYIGSFSNSEKKLKVVAASANQMGMTASTVTAMKVIENFRPKYLAMTGITAGLKGKANIGDIIACELSWDYGSGKISCDDTGNLSFSPDYKSLNLDTSLKEKFQSICLEELYVDDIKRSFMGDKPESSLKLVVGPIASGAAVIQNSELIELIKSHNRKVAGVEMEAYGIFYAAQNCKKPQPQCIVVKSVCDFADQNKDDDYQRYAAFTSSQFLYKFSLDHL